MLGRLCRVGEGSIFETDSIWGSRRFYLGNDPQVIYSGSARSNPILTLPRKTSRTGRWDAAVHCPVMKVKSTSWCKTEGFQDSTREFVEYGYPGNKID